MDMTLEQFTKALERLAEEHPKKVQDKIEQTGYVLIREIKLNAPVGKYDDGTPGGFLRDSFDRVGVIGPFRTLEGYEVQIGSNAEYAAHVEYGHVTRLGQKKDETGPDKPKAGSSATSPEAEKSKAKKKSSIRKAPGSAPVAYVEGRYFVRNSVESVAKDLPDDIKRWVEDTLKELLR